MRASGCLELPVYVWIVALYHFVEVLHAQASQLQRHSEVPPSNKTAVIYGAAIHAQRSHNDWYLVVDVLRITGMADK
jgi:hypothetical protein